MLVLNVLYYTLFSGRIIVGDDLSLPFLSKLTKLMVELAKAMADAELIIEKTAAPSTSLALSNAYVWRITLGIDSPKISQHFV